MTTTTRVLLLVAVGIGVLSTFALVAARRRVQVLPTLPARLAVYMHGAVIAAMVLFVVWPVLHYVGVRADSGLRHVPSAPFMLASAAVMTTAVGLGAARLVMALSGRRPHASGRVR